MDFDRFDIRHYPTLSGSGTAMREWATTYEGVVQDEMDLRLLERLTTVAGPRLPARSISRAAPGASAAGCARRACGASTAST